MSKMLVALVGMQHRGTVEVVKNLPDREPLTLIRDPDNAFDPLAVQVWARDVHIGFIKATQVRPISLAMDRASSLRRSAVLSTANGERWPMVELEEGWKMRMGRYLVDRLIESGVQLAEARARIERLEFAHKKMIESLFPLAEIMAPYNDPPNVESLLAIAKRARDVLVEAANDVSRGLK